MDLPSIGNMSSTHSANPLVCAAGLAVLEEIKEKDLVNVSKQKGDLLICELNKLKSKFPHRISHVLGKGLIAAILFQSPIDKRADSLFASMVSEKCMQKGLLVVHTGRESIKIGPPLVISEEALLEGVKVIDESIIELDKKLN